MNTPTAPSRPTPASGNLRQVMVQHPLFSYFFIAYAFSWIVSIPYVLSAWGILPGNYQIVFILKPYVGPALAAIIMTGMVEGKAGLLRLRGSIRQWRAGWQWYLFVLVGIPALFLLGIAVQPGALAGRQGVAPGLLVSYAVSFVIVIFGGGPLGEEIGWRGFALPRMQPRYGPLWGTLLLGVLWCLWHLPDFLTPAQGGGPGTGLSTFFVNFSVFLLLVLSLAVIFTWVFNHTTGSVLIAILLHASVNTPQLVLAPLFPAVNWTVMNAAALIGFGLPALLLLILTRGRLGYRPSPQ